MYTEKVMDHFQHPRNVGELENASGVGTVGNAKCGDIMRIYLDIDENQIIRDVKFKTFGCSNKQYGDRTCKREKYSGGNESNKQSCDGGS
jgi:NifU-like protein involved in Fe-S cluster formation